MLNGSSVAYTSANIGLLPRLYRLLMQLLAASMHAGHNRSADLAPPYAHFIAAL